MSFLSYASYKAFLDERIGRLDDPVARNHVSERFSGWHQGYRLHRLLERASELLASERTRPNMLHLGCEADLTLLGHLARRHRFDARRFRGFLVADSLWDRVKPEWFSPFPVYRTGQWQDREGTVVVSLSLDRPFREGRSDRGNDYLECFIDLNRFSVPAAFRREFVDRQVVLYVTYRMIQTLPAISDQIRKSSDMVTALLVDSAPAAAGREFDAVMEEPFFYLWPLLFKHLAADLFHINVGWGTQGLPFMPFVPDSQKAIVDFYDVTTLIPDESMNPRHPEPLALTRASEKYLWKTCNHFVHRCSEETSERLEEKYPHARVASVVEYVKDPVSFQPARKKGDIRLVYGGLLLQDASDVHSVFYSRFRSLVDYFAHGNLHLFVYPSPYLYGFGRPKAVDELVETQGLTNVHPCEPLEEDQWIQEISRYDYGVCIPGDARPCVYPYILPFKVIAYLRAGLPLVVPEDHTFIADLVRKNEIGVVYGYDDADRMADLLNSQDIDRLKSNVLRFRERFRTDRAAQKVMALYNDALGSTRRTAACSAKLAVRRDPKDGAISSWPSLMEKLDRSGFIGADEYNHLLEQEIGRIFTGVALRHATDKFRRWFAAYRDFRCASRVVELVAGLKGAPYHLYLDDPTNLNALAGVVQGLGQAGLAPPVAFIAGQGAEQLRPRLAPHHVVGLGDGVPEGPTVIGLSGKPFSAKGHNVLINDYLERFIDPGRFRAVRQSLDRDAEKETVLYPLYREIHTMAIMARFIRAKDERFRVVSLSPSPLLDADFDAMLVEPFFYLWPLLLRIVDPSVVHLNVGWGIQALALSPFIPDRRRTVIDFYEVLSSLPDAFFEKTHSSAEEVREAERHFVTNYDHVIHLCSDEVSERMRNQYNPAGSIVSVTEYLYEPTYDVPTEKHDDIRIVYGGAMLASNSPDNMYYDAFLKAARHFTRDNLHLHIYNSPYLNGTGENTGLREVIRQHGLTQVYACQPLKLEDFVKTITQYDYGTFLLRAEDMKAGDTYNQYMATKFLMYLRAGLPVIIHAENRFMADLVRRYNIGVVLQDGDLERLPEILNHTDLPSLKKNVIRFRNEFSIEKGGAKVLRMYHDILEQGNRKTHPSESASEREAFEGLISSMARTENRLYYRDQSAQTMTSLAGYARALDPTVIVELGTLAGLSLRTWVTSAQRAKIYAVDLSFDKLRETMNLLPVDLSRVTLLEQDILKTDFSCLWTEQDRVIFFVDAHDLPGVPIMEHVLTTALPALPDGSLVIVDDLWFSEERLTRDNAQAFLDGRVVGEIDELQCFEGHYAPYHEGGSFMGFAEVGPLLEFVNRHGIELRHDVGGKHVSFVWRRACLSHIGEAVAAGPRGYYGSVSYNPLMSVPVSASLAEPMQRIAQDYRQKRIAQAAQGLADLRERHPGEPGLAYGLAVCHARCGQLDQARDMLGRVVHDTNDRRCRRLFDDLVARVGPCDEPQPHIARGSSRNASGLTIFAMPKAFEGHIGTIQRNAIRSWARLDPAPEILLFGDEPGICEMAEEVGARHIPHVDRNEFGTPLVNKLFEAAQAHASHEIMAYVNADMILFREFVDGVRKVRTELDRFLLIGQRWDIPILEEIDFRQPGWQRWLQEQMEEHAMLHAECGLDYFVFPKGLYRQIPPFAVGRIAWDNWLVMAPHRDGVPVVDGTEFITVVHQDHDYGHVAGGRREAWTGAEASRNRVLAGTVDDSAYTSGAHYILRRNGRVVKTPPREPLFGTTAYREYRHAWLTREAQRLMALGRMELAATKWEESLPILERLLIAARRKARSGGTDGKPLAECYVTSCISMAQCYMKQGRYDQVVTSYTRLLETPLFELPQKQRDDIQRVCDQLREHPPQGGRSQGRLSGNRNERYAPARTVERMQRDAATRQGPDQKRLALVVSVPERADDLRRIITDIEDQFDEIRVLLNEYETVPEDLRRFAKVSRIETSARGELFASGVWTLLTPEDEGYVFVLDDDITYPPDYADTMIAKIEEHQRRAVVVVHGMDFCPPFADFVVDRTLYHFESACRRDRTVHAGGVGTLVFHTSTIRPDSRDLCFAVLAAKRKVPIVCIARDDGWLLSKRKRGRQLWHMTSQPDQRNLRNGLFQIHLLPLLNIDARQVSSTDHCFSIFSFTNGRSTFDYSVRSLTDSWDRHETIVVLRDMPFFEAATKCLKDCRTPYFFKVDDDFILHPKAIAYMRKQVLEYPCPEELGIYYCHLWEDWTGRVRQSIKVYRAEALRRIGGFQTNDQGKVDEATKVALERAGFKVVEDPSVVALHACGSWEEQLEYERLWSAMAEVPYQKPTRDAMKTYCGTKSLDTQYAMRLDMLESINRQLGTPFHRFLVEGSTAPQSVASPEDLRRRSDASLSASAVDADDSSESLLHPPFRPHRQRVRDLGLCGAAPVPCESQVDGGRRPRVTVITACRNAARFLPECLDSILPQTLGEWELFLLDDGSTDDTHRIMEEYARRDKRIQVHGFDDNRGPYVRRNFAIERARADFIVIHDADDIMCPTKLETLYNEISSDGNLAMVGSNYRSFIEEYQGPECSESSELPLTHDEILARFRSWQHGMSHGSAMLRRALFREIGPYDENPFAADSFWSAKLALYAESGRPVRVQNVPECLTLVRMHASNHARLLSTLDPRNRRIRYRQYCECKLRRVRDRMKSQPNMDIGRELRQCTCSDFLTRFKAQIIAWENEPLDSRVVPEYLRSAVRLFDLGRYVNCASILNSVESFEPTIADRMAGYDLLRGLAYFALRLERQARLHLDREIRRHDTPAARRFVEDAFESGTAVDVRSWCRDHAERYNMGLEEAGPRKSPQIVPSIGAI
ncbi:glycosyltransferase [Anaerobaca lacustris]|uniref:Glycosyltransferase n=1 Tax=Anaerobaca lacustris TaxID=3044600 RepID=A0AAW6TXF9_9BACT|nr:glycosyltransferase [Sedimentisphaerales bacterium M17dextr]